MSHVRSLSCYVCSISHSPTIERKRAATASRRERLNALKNAWTSQMDDLASAYLRWKHRDTHAQAQDGHVGESMEMDVHVFKVVAIYTHRTYLSSLAVTATFTVYADKVASLPITQGPVELANVALVKEGLLGCSPVSPEVAVSLDTLELYHRLRRRHPQLGIQAMARALCDLHNVSQTFDTASCVLMLCRSRTQLPCVNICLWQLTCTWRSCARCSNASISPSSATARTGV